MLQVTDAAAAVFRRVLEPEPQNTIRIQSTLTPDGDVAIAFRAVDGPQAGDAPTEAPDVDVFVAPELAEALEHVILDARETPEGAEMFIRDQEGEPAGG